MTNNHYEQKIVVFSEDGMRQSKPYDEVKDFVNGFAIVRNGTKFGFIDSNLVEVVSPKYVDVHNFSNGYAVVKNDCGWGAINEAGNEVVKPQFNYLGNFTNAGLAPFRFMGKYGAVNHVGDIVVEAKYRSPIVFKEGLAAVKLGYRWGFINEKFEEIISAKYDLVSDFRGGRALVVFSNGEKHFINRCEEIID